MIKIWRAAVHIADGRSAGNSPFRIHIGVKCRSLDYQICLISYRPLTQSVPKEG